MIPEDRKLFSSYTRNTGEKVFILIFTAVFWLPMLRRKKINNEPGGLTNNRIFSPYVGDFVG